MSNGNAGNRWPTGLGLMMAADLKSKLFFGTFKFAVSLVAGVAAKLYKLILKFKSYN